TKALCSGRSLAPTAGLCGIPEEKSVARPGQRQNGARRPPPRAQRRGTGRGGVPPAVRTKFQAAALLLRDERARVRAAGSDSHRAEKLKSLDDIAAILATIHVQV